MLAAATSAIPPRQLPLHDLCTHAITGHHAPISCLATHPGLPLALTADEAGFAMLWHTHPLKPLGGLAGAFDGAPAETSQLRVESACWLACEAPSSTSAQVKGVLAVGTDTQVCLIEISLNGSNTSTITTTSTTPTTTSKAGGSQDVSLQLLSSADISQGYHSIQSLCVLHQPSGKVATDHSSPSHARSQDQSSPSPSRHLLVGFLGLGQQSGAKTHSQTDSFNQTAADAIAVWGVTLASATSGAQPGQGQTQQPSSQAQLNLLACHKLPVQSTAKATCIMPASEAAFQLMVGTSDGVVQLLQTEATGQACELTSCKQLKNGNGSTGTLR